LLEPPLSADALFQPYEFKGLKLPNRVVMAPMTRSKSPGGIATDEVAAYYARRAAAEVGLVISEGAGVARPASLNDPDIPRFHGEAELAAWKTVIDAVHAAGGLMAPQLWHVGAVRSRRQDWAPSGPYDSPSGLSSPGHKFGEGMTDAEVADAISAFATAAASARQLGFDAVELHGAHGYLIDQFFWEGTNERRDLFGGPTVGARAKFAAEILKAVRAAVGPDYPVIIRLSQWKQQDFTARIAPTPADMEAWLEPLAAAGADAFHCSQRRFWEAGVRGLRPQLRRLGQEADRQDHDHRRLGGSHRRVHRGLRRRSLEAGVARPAAAHAGARRLRPRRRRPRPAAGPAVGAESSRRPHRRPARLRAFGNGDALLASPAAHIRSF
jgi:2,4-dienoyl-CoA reductase-like NADH-dependent reductase (Old Yellow Enzyme family)